MLLLCVVAMSGCVCVLSHSGTCACSLLADPPTARSERRSKAPSTRRRSLFRKPHSVHFAVVPLVPHLLYSPAQGGALLVPRISAHLSRRCDCFGDLFDCLVLLAVAAPIGMQYVENSRKFSIAGFVRCHLLFRYCLSTSSRHERPHACCSSWLLSSLFQEVSRSITTTTHRSKFTATFLVMFSRTQPPPSPTRSPFVLARSGTDSQATFSFRKRECCTALARLLLRSRCSPVRLTRLQRTPRVYCIRIPRATTAAVSISLWDKRSPAAVQ